MTLYEHVQDYAALRDLIDEAVIDENGNPRELDESTKAAINALADDWKADFQAKAERTCRYRQDIAAHIEACKVEEARLAARRKMYEIRLRGVNYLLQTTMNLLGIRKFEAGTFGLSLAKNPPSLLVEKQDAIPAEFFDEVPASIVLNNAKLKEALSGGREIEGARLFQGESLRVK